MITNTNNRTLLSVAGTTYDFEFRIDDDSELKVYGIDADGDSTLLTTGFTISFDAENEEGTVTFSVEPSSYEEILMLRSKAYTQNTDIPIRSGFSEEDIENALDNVVMLIQQLKEITDYCVKFDLTSETTGVTLPSPEAGKPIVGNSTNDGFVNSDFDLTSLEDDVAGVAAAVIAAAASASAASGSASAASASAVAAAASAASINLPAAAGNSLKLLRQNVGETALEYVAPSAFDSVFAMNGKIFKFAKGADVASVAGAITLGDDGNFFDITGTNAITSITAKTAGTIVMLQFDSTASLVDGSNLKLNGDFLGAAESTIVLVSDGTNWFELTRVPDSASAVPTDIQVFTASGTWTRPAGKTRALAKVWGAGGGGGTTAGATEEGGGGGGGGYSEGYTNVTGNVTVTVGAGGAAGAPGTTGGTSSFAGATTVQATGGAGGSGGNNGAGGAGGAGSNGQINISGINGTAGDTDTAGKGGPTFGFAGPAAQSTTEGAGSDGNLYGTGGNGANGGASGFAGGAGKAGLVIVYS